MSEEILADIRKRNQERKDSGMIGGMREGFDIDFLLRYIDKQNELRPFIEHEIKMAETADAFYEYSRGWIDGLKRVLKEMDK